MPLSLDELARKWSVAVERAFETETSIIAFVSRNAVPLVLKVAKEPGAESRCGEVLAAFDGRGVVRVHEHVDGAVLMERAVPGASLAAMVKEGRDEEATAILADVMVAMRGVPPSSECVDVHEWGRAFERYIASGDRRIDADLVAEASRVYEALAASQSHTLLLHGDLHHDNVVHDATRGWLAIDPKGVVGELEYEVGAALRNPIDRPDLFTSPATIERRVDQFARRLHLDANRITQWAFAQSVLAAVWVIEDGHPIHTDHPFVRLARALRR